MARNDIYLNINALSPADAVVTGQQDMTASTIPELVLGDTPTFNFYFTDNTNVWPSWAGNAAYTLTWALSDAVAGDFAPAATTANATPITGGWSVVLPLNAYDLVGLLNTKRVGQPFPVQNLWQQLRVTDPSGNEITRAMFWTPVRYRAISDTQNTESASPTGGRFVTVNNVNTLTTPTAAQFYAANPVPTSALGTATNGELLIGNGTGFTKSTLTAGDGITITNAAGSITIDASTAQEKLTATVKNAESTPITKGQVVYLFGATGNMASVKLAYNTSDATSAKTFGVVSSSSISAGGTGLVTCVGVVDGLNLGAYQDGDTLYLGATPGSVTATKPYAPNHLVYVGVVERANSGNGELYVKVQNGYELDEIHDVQINAPRQSGQTLIYDNTTSLWKNARITAGTNIGVTNGDGSISIAFSGTLPVDNGGTGVTTSTGSGSVVLSTSPTLTTPILGTPQSGTLSSCTGLPISSGVSGLGTNVASALGTNVGSAGAFVVNGGALGTPSSGTLSSCSGLPISTGVSGLGTNVATALATNIGSSGAVVVNGGALGTPSSGTLSSCSGLPISTGVSGLGTGIASALGTNVGTAGSVVVNGGALGTPSSGTLSSCSGLPISTGVSGLGTNVATFLATPSSANLAAAVTDETGSGALVFANTPTLVTPNIGAATGTSVNLSGNATVGGKVSVNGGDTAVAQMAVLAPANTLVANLAASTTSNQSFGIRVFAGTSSSDYALKIRNASDATTLLNVDGVGATTVGGNLTVSGTGTSSVAGSFGIGGASPVVGFAGNEAAWIIGATRTDGSGIYPVTLSINDSRAYNSTGPSPGGGIGFTYKFNSSGTFAAGVSIQGFKENTTDGDYAGGLRFLTRANGAAPAEAARFASTGNLLLGTPTDGGQKLQVAGTAYVSGRLTTNTGTLVTGGESISTGSGQPIGVQLRYGSVADTGELLAFDWANNGAKNLTLRGTALTLQTGTFGSTTALTLDSSQNATFAGTVTVNGRDLLVNSAGPRVLWKDTSNTQDLWQASVDNDSTQAWNLINNTSGYGTVMRFSRLGALRLNNYGAGTLSTDSSGNVTASSDARLKTNLRTFARGLADVLKLAPKLYNWNEASGLDTENDYVGFVAQEVQTAIPEAVYEGKDQAKTLTLNDRAILAALVNAVKELNAKLS